MKLGTSSRGRAERAVGAAIVMLVGFATTIVAAPHAFATPITYVVDSTADTDGNTAAGNTNNGIPLDSDSGDVIGGSAATRNVLSGNDSTGIRVTNASLNTIAGNYIGTNAAGTAKVPNNTGIFLSIGATNNTIGTGNLLSGNDYAGVMMESSATGNVVVGNRIGTDPTGQTALDTGVLPQSGIVLNGTDGNTIGGATQASANTISGNYIGVIVSVTNGTGNTVEGNRIGVAADGTTALGNTQDGLNLNGANNTLIGGTTAGTANIIANNGADGIIVRGGTGNRIETDSIHDNGTLGIDLTPSLNSGPDGVTANGSGQQNFPILTSASSDGTNTTVQGTLTANAGTTYRIEIFASAACDSSGNGEGATFVGTTTSAGDGSTFTI